MDPTSVPSTEDATPVAPLSLSELLEIVDISADVKRLLCRLYRGNVQHVLEDVASRSLRDFKDYSLSLAQRESLFLGAQRLADSLYVVVRTGGCRVCCSENLLDTTDHYVPHGMPLPVNSGCHSGPPSAASSCAPSPVVSPRMCFVTTSSEHHVTADSGEETDAEILAVNGPESKQHKEPQRHDHHQNTNAVTTPASSPRGSLDSLASLSSGSLTPDHTEVAVRVSISSEQFFQLDDPPGGDGEATTQVPLHARAHEEVENKWIQLGEGLYLPCVWQGESLCVPWREAVEEHLIVPLRRRRSSRSLGCSSPRVDASVADCDSGSFVVPKRLFPEQEGKRTHKNESAKTHGQIQSLVPTPRHNQEHENKQGDHIPSSPRQPNSCPGSPRTPELAGKKDGSEQPVAALTLNTAVSSNKRTLHARSSSMTPRASPQMMTSPSPSMSSSSSSRSPSWSPNSFERRPVGVKAAAAKQRKRNKTAANLKGTLSPRSMRARALRGAEKQRRVGILRQRSSFKELTRPEREPKHVLEIVGLSAGQPNPTDGEDWITAASPPTNEDGRVTRPSSAATEDCEDGSGRKAIREHGSPMQRAKQRGENGKAVMVPGGKAKVKNPGAPSPRTKARERYRRLQLIMRGVKPRRHSTGAKLGTKKASNLRFVDSGKPSSVSGTASHIRRCKSGIVAAPQSLSSSTRSDEKQRPLPALQKGDSTNKLPRREAVFI